MVRAVTDQGGLRGRTQGWLAVLTVAVLMAGCTQPPVPEDRYYRLAVAAPDKPLAKPTLEGTLEVPPFQADGVTAQREIVYIDSAKPHELKKYNYHFWTDAPPVMIRDQLIDYLRAANVAVKVVTPDLRVDADYVLSGRIKRLERIVGTPSRAAVELELGLTRFGGGKLLFLESYSVDVAASGDTVGAAVDAMNAALGEVYTKFVNDLSKL